MKSIARLLLLAVAPLCAWADPAGDAANRAFAQALAESQGGGGAFSPRMQRLIGWEGSAVRSLSPAERLNRLIEAHWAWSQQIEPENATFTGFPGQNGRWSDLSFEALATRQSLEREFLSALLAVNEEELLPEQRLNLALLRYGAEQTVAGHAFPAELMPVNQMFGLQTWVASVLNAQPLFSAADRADFLSRLKGLPLLFSQMRSLLAKGLEAGVTPPQITLQKVPQQFLDLAPEDGRASPLLQSFQRLPGDLSATEREAFEQQALALYQAELRPAVLAAAVYVRDVYLPGAVRATGLNHLPDGKAWYAHNAAVMTTTDLSPEQIHQIGLDEVERISAEIRKVMKEVGFKGTVPAFTAKVKKDPRWFFRNEEDYLTAYRALGKLVDARLPRLFKEFAALPYGIEAVPAYRAAGSATAYYLPGSAEFGRAGVFYINTLRMPDAPKYEMEALLLHEAVPGHHFQIALAQELEGLPEFRKHGRFTAYTEGWGLYAESLGPELGLYQDPYTRFGALTFEIWRAIRLVVDTGMHALGWSREQAITYFAENTGRSRERIEAEVDRYLVMPGQALAYKIGQLKIQELRNRAEQALGEAFDLRSFHQLVLGAGALPLMVLEQRVNEWIAVEQAAGEGG